MGYEYHKHGSRLVVEHAKTAIVAALLEHQVLRAGQETYGWTCLHTAVEDKRLDVVISLLKHGADPC